MASGVPAQSLQHIGAAGDVGHLLRIALLVRQALAGKHQREGPSRRSIADFQATADSTVSQGRQVCILGVERRAVSCSTGWCVGPSSPRPMESWVNTKMDCCFISAAMRTALRAYSMKIRKVAP